MRKINTRSIINFDNSATTYPKPPAVAKAVAQAVERYGGNPGRSGHKLSMRVSEKIFTVRQQAAEITQTSPGPMRYRVISRPSRDNI